MAGLKHIKDLINKEGIEILDNYTIISEKLDGSRFSTEKYTNGFSYYKRNASSPIDLIDRTMMVLYEHPIEYIESLKDNVRNDIPYGWRFGFEYFYNKKPVKTAYDKLPKNNLILTDISINKTTLGDTKVLRNWATFLGVEPAPIIFEGYLTNIQKDKLIKLVDSNTDTFTRDLMQIIDPTITKTLLMENLDKSIEGVVLKFPNKNKSAKIVDPKYTDQVKLDKNRAPSDSYSIVLIDIMNYIKEFNLDHYTLFSDNPDERYLELVNILYNKYIDESFKYKNLEIDTPDFAKMPEFNINYKFINNVDTILNLKKSQNYRSLYKIFLGTFKKIRKRTSPLIDETMKNHINDTVNKIYNKIQSQNTELPTFNDYYRGKKTKKFKGE